MGRSHNTRKLTKDEAPLNIRRVLRTFYEEAKLAETDGEREQLITKVVEQIQACRFCAFEKEQAERGDE